MTTRPTTTAPTRRRRARSLATALSAMVLLGACAAGEDAATEPEAPTTATPQERIVVIGEEYLLADLLALGVQPVAATATVAESGFQGLDDHDTSGIQALPATERNLERLASLEADRIIVLDFFAEEIGRETLEGMAAEVTVVPDGTDPIELVTTYGELFGRQERAAELVDEYEAAQTAAAEALGGLEVSVAAIYAGPSVAAFVDGPWAVPQTLLDAGATLVPSPEEAAPDANGRVYLSEERWDVLSAPQMVLMQSSLVEGEDLAVDEVTSDPLWESLPAVQADAVTVLDRLAYPGIEGRIRLIDDLIAGLGNR